MCVADKTFELKLHSESIEFLDLLSQLRKLFIQRELVSNAYRSSLRVQAALHLIIIHLLCYELKRTHQFF